MRLVVAGIGPDGRSTVVQDAVVDVGDDDSPRSAKLWATSGSPPTVERLPPGEARPVDAGPGETRWTLRRFPAGEYPVHRTDTISYNTVLRGTIEVVLEDGGVTLHEGDFLVCLGVLHGWKVPDGHAVLSSALIGIDPPT